MFLEVVVASQPESLLSFPGKTTSKSASRFLIFILILIQANYCQVLEIGTFIGFSTLGWASAVGPEGHVTTLEFSPEYASIAKESLDKYGAKNAEVIVGDAQES